MEITVEKLAWMHHKMRRHPLCGFLKSRGSFTYGKDTNGDDYNFGTHYDLPFIPAGDPTPLEGFFTFYLKATFSFENQSTVKTGY